VRIESVKRCEQELVSARHVYVLEHLVVVGVEVLLLLLLLIASRGSTSSSIVQQ